METKEALGRRILRETTRFAGIQVLGAALFALTDIVVARLLGPRSAGAYDMGAFYLGLGALFGDGGLGAAMIRQKGDVSRETYRTALTFLLAIGLTMAVAFFIAAPYIARHAQFSPRDVPVLRAMAVLFLVGPVRSVPYIRLERELRFGRIASIELAATVARQLVTIALAWRYGGVLALIGGQVAGAATQLTLAWRAAPGWPGLGLSRRVLQATLGEGVPVQALAIFAYFKDNLSAVLLGSLMGAPSVGLFNKGTRFAALPVQAVNALSRVQFPVYAQFKARDPQLHASFVGATRTALLLGVPLLAVLSIAAPALVPALYGAQWSPCVPVVHGILVNMAFGLLAGPLFALLQAQGRAGLALKVFAGWTIATWGLVLVVWHRGLGAVACAYSAVTAVVVIGLVRWAARHMGKPLWGAYAGPLLAGLAAWSLLWVRWPGPWARAGLALAVYAAGLALLEGRRALDDLRAWVTTLRSG